MKTIFTMLAALMIFSTAMAFAPQTVISVSSVSRPAIYVTIDNMNRSGTSSNDVSIENIQPGYHILKVYANGRTTGNRRNNNRELLYKGTVLVKAGYQLDITINRFGKAFIDERKLGYSWNDDTDQAGDEDENMNVMNDSRFSQFKRTISNSRFDNTKLSLATETISYNYFTTSQVKQIVDLFSFESSKLQIAKSAYRNTTDKHNYFLICDALSFDSSKEELAKFMETSR